MRARFSPGAPDAHKLAILAAAGHHRNNPRLLRSGCAGTCQCLHPETNRPGKRDSPYPLQNASTRAMRTGAAKQGIAEFLSLWAGQGVARARVMPAGELVSRLVAEM
jgi:nitronate monooxygenase